MRIARLTSLLGLMALAPAALATDRPLDVTIFGTLAHFSTSTTTDSFGTGVAFRDEGGAGLSINVPVVRWLSVEVGALAVRPEGTVTFRGTTIASMGHANMVPVFAIVEAHPAGRGNVDPYLGVGGAYTSFGAYSSRDLDLMGVGRVEVDGKFGLAVSAGTRLALGRLVGFTVDAKYLWLKPSSTGSAQGGKVDLELNPFLISGGLSFRF